MDLNGKNVIYIGGFGGIGLHCLREFLHKGVKNVVVFDLKKDSTVLDDLRRSFAAANIIFIQLDITKIDNIESAFKKAVDQIGHFDVLVNGSGMFCDRMVDLTIQINLLGPIHTTLTAIKYMDKAQGGRGGLIINISSIAGLEPISIGAIYTATKFGVLGFTRSLANPLYYQRTGIGYITICPGFTSTPLVDDLGSRSTFDYETPMTKSLSSIKYQKPEDCAKNLVKAVEFAKNGSVWLLDLGDMKEVEFPVMWTPTFET